MVLINVVTPALLLDKNLLEAVKSVKFQKCSSSVFIKHYIIFDNEDALDAHYNPVDDIERGAENYSVEILIASGFKNGPSYARNLALDKITTGYIYFLDGDDLWSGDYIEKTLELYKNVSTVAVSVLGEKLKNGFATGEPAQVRVCEKRINSDISWNIIGCPSGFSFSMDRLTDKNVRFNESLKFFEDWYFYLNILSKNRGMDIIKTCKTKYYYRINDNQATSNVNIDFLKKSYRCFLIKPLDLTLKERYFVHVQKLRLFMMLSHKGFASSFYAVIFSFFLPNLIFYKIRGVFFD